MTAADKPIAVVIAGMPGVGKSTLALALEGKLGYIRVSRDEVKQGLLMSLGQSHLEAEANINQVASSQFFSKVDLLLKSDKNVIAEAAFQHKAWAAWFQPVAALASVRLLVCEVPVALAIERFDRRRMEDPERIQFHGDDVESSHRLIEAYQAPDLDRPTMRVDTTNGYKPGLSEIMAFCQ